MVAWRSGYASVCKTEYAGSIPAATSNYKFWADDEIGIHSTLKMSRHLWHAGSSPAPPTNKKRALLLFLFFFDVGIPEGFKDAFESVVNNLTFDNHAKLFFERTQIDFVFSINHDFNLNIK